MPHPAQPVTTTYGIAAQEIAELFCDYLDGDELRPALVISERTLPEEAHAALERSIESFGYTPDTCTFATLAPKTHGIDDERENRKGIAVENMANIMSENDDTTPNSDAASTPLGEPPREPGPALDPSALFMLIEGLDPRFVISADSATTTQLANAYRENLSLYTPYADDSEARLFGRPAVMFANFPSLLATPESKQHAWRLLKTLPS